MGNNVAEATLVEDPIYQSLVDCGIMYHRKYFPFCTLHKQTYLRFIGDYIKEKKGGMSAKERVGYYLWQKSRDDILKPHWELEPTQSQKNKNMHTKKAYLFYEVGECYFEQPTIDDLRGNKYSML